MGWLFGKKKPKVPVHPPHPEAPAPAMVPQPSGPLFVKVGVYQRILGEVDDLKAQVAGLAAANRKLEDSEYNEEHHFEKLKRSVKVMHDRLLQVDKTIYKGQGD